MVKHRVSWLFDFELYIHVHNIAQNVQTTQLVADMSYEYGNDCVAFIYLYCYCM